MWKAYETIIDRIWCLWRTNLYTHLSSMAGCQESQEC